MATAAGEDSCQWRRRLLQSTVRVGFSFGDTYLLTGGSRLGDECQPFEMDPPQEALFDPKKVVIISNGRFVPRLDALLNHFD